MDKINKIQSYTVQHRATQTIFYNKNQWGKKEPVEKNLLKLSITISTPETHMILYIN